VHKLLQISIVPLAADLKANDTSVEIGKNFDISRKFNLKTGSKLSLQDDYNLLNKTANLV
jgi:hypothetical protein